MDPLLIASGLIAFPPAMLVFFLYLNPYYTRLREEKAFYSFVFGMFMGMLAGAMHLLVGASVIFVIPVFDVMFLTAVLNSSRLRGRPMTVYYGTAMGIGYAAMVLVVWGFLLLVRSASPWTDAARAVIVAFPFAVTYGGIGAYIGQGAATGRLWGHVARAVLMLIPFFVFIDMFSWEGMTGAMVAVPIAGLLLYGGLMYRFTSDTVLPMGMVLARRSGARRRVR